MFEMLFFCWFAFFAGGALRLYLLLRCFCLLHPVCFYLLGIAFFTFLLHFLGGGGKVLEPRRVHGTLHTLPS